MSNQNIDAASGSNDHSGTKSGAEYWMSLEHLNHLHGNDAGFAERAEAEFLSSPFKTEDGKDGIARRDFLKLMGASLALASASCIRRPVQKIIPYAKAPMEITPGVPNYYASTWFDGTEGYGTLVKTLEGRPIKLDGNPNHPMNAGALSARAHAEVLALYDPDRLRGPVHNLLNKERTNKESVGVSWADADSAITQALAKGGVAILSSTLPSPSLKAVIGDFTKAFPGTRWVQYDTQSTDAVREAQRLAYGKAVVPRYRFDQAKMVVAIDCDFLGTYLSPSEFTKSWAKGRRPGSAMSRLVSFESTMSLTGMNADDRYRIRPSQQLSVALGLLQSLAKAGKVSLPANVASTIGEYADAPEKMGLSREAFDKIAMELAENRGHSLVVAGGVTAQTEDAVELQLAVNLLNSLLGNDGTTVDHSIAPFQTRQGSSQELASLIADMAAGKVKTLIIHDLNPGYALPKDSGFLAALSKVDLVVDTDNYNAETARFAHYVLPSGNSLESWGDYELQTGLWSIGQPTIRPLYDTRSFGESMLAWTKSSKSAPGRASGAKEWYDYVSSVWKSEIYPKSNEGHGRNFDEFFAEVLQQGAVSQAGLNRDKTESPRAVQASALKFKSPGSAKSGYELALYSTQQLSDGRYANIPWVQELPDPVTKVVWDNHLSISMKAARTEKLKDGDVVVVKVGQKSLSVPVLIQPGMPEDVVALSIGYGRTLAGKVGKDIGFDAFQLASFGENGKSVYSGQVCTIAKSGSRHEVATTQHHHILGDDIKMRQIVVETTNSAFQKNPASGIEKSRVFSIWPSHQYTKHRWAMSIDLNSCTGCSACVIACMSENNVPVVGKRYVMEGREMHWIRVDRYYKGNPEAPETVVMPLVCQQCENAPCETVCPVIATSHNEEGLNDMVYNRCVGTRYCSNNCPYKVRRFNWFNYSKREEPTNMALNPDVTVRTRGVMEKCTFCVHRIRHATAGKKNEVIADGTIKTACQQTCPTDAIVFGDLSDKDSQVSKIFQEARAYSLLEELNTVPRVRYLSRVRNAERAMEGENT